MNTVEITDAEREVLREILTSALNNLDVEIHRTDNLEFKNALGQRRRLLSELSEKLQNVTIPSA